MSTAPICGSPDNGVIDHPPTILHFQPLNLILERLSNHVEQISWMLSIVLKPCPEFQNIVQKLANYDCGYGVRPFTAVSCDSLASY